MDKYRFESVYQQNIRNNQIGGEFDGITPEVAADIGYHTPEQLKNLPELPDVKPFTSEPTSAEERGIAMAKLYLNNPDDFGSDWPSAIMGKQAKKAIPRSIDQVRESLKPRTTVAIGNTAMGATKRYIDSRKDILGGR